MEGNGTVTFACDWQPVRYTLSAPFASYLPYDLPFSEGILNGTAEFTGGAQAFKARGEFALQQAVLLPGR